MSVRQARERIDGAVTAWQGVEAQPHRRGGIEYRLGKREIGHSHGNSLVDIPFPTKVRDEIVASGQAEPHHVLPESGWVSVHLNEPEDVERAIGLLRRSYDIAHEQKAKHAASP